MLPAPCLTLTVAPVVVKLLCGALLLEKPGPHPTQRGSAARSDLVRRSLPVPVTLTSAAPHRAHRE